MHSGNRDSMTGMAYRRKYILIHLKSAAGVGGIDDNGRNDPRVA